MVSSEVLSLTCVTETTLEICCLCMSGGKRTTLSTVPQVTSTVFLRPGFFLTRKSLYHDGWAISPCLSLHSTGIPSAAIMHLECMWYTFLAVVLRKGKGLVRPSCSLMVARTLREGGQERRRGGKGTGARCPFKAPPSAHLF